MADEQTGITDPRPMYGLERFSEMTQLEIEPLGFGKLPKSSAYDSSTGDTLLQQMTVRHLLAWRFADACKGLTGIVDGSMI
jgi:hypothetical protein